MVLHETWGRVSEEVLSVLHGHCQRGNARLAHDEKLLREQDDVQPHPDWVPELRCHPKTPDRPFPRHFPVRRP